MSPIPRPMRSRCLEIVVAIVVVTSYLRIRLGRRIWKSFHFIICPAAALFRHCLFIDPVLKIRRQTTSTASKLLVESCLATIVILAALRYRRSLLKSGRTSSLECRTPCFRAMDNDVAS